jgi:hypothetical protein
MTMSKTDAVLRKELVNLLTKEQAHASLEDVVRGFPAGLRGVVVDGLPYSAWQLLDHMRIAQHDILKFSTDAKYKSPKWPDGYWAKKPAPPNGTAWTAAIKQIAADRRAFVKLVQTKDLLTPFPWGDGQNLLREALLIADHNAYHVGELLVARRLLGAWKK